LGVQAELFDGLNCQAGALVSRKQLSDDLSTLLSCVPPRADEALALVRSRATRRAARACSRTWTPT
jgi:hypothetical protein